MVTIVMVMTIDSGRSSKRVKKEETVSDYITLHHITSH